MENKQAPVQGAIIEQHGLHYTYFRELFRAMGGFQLDYNWLITDCNIISSLSAWDEASLPHKDHIWISGRALTDFVEAKDPQWVWGVLSGFPPQYTYEQVMEYELPYADGYPGFWQLPVTMQHPLASVELVAWDSGATLLFTREPAVMDAFKTAYPWAEDLAEYNA